jgi:arabinose-5-phosphate isomerase
MNNILDVAREVFKIERDSISEVKEKLDENFEKAVEILYACKGRICVTGMGKSGNIAQKTAATLSSTGAAAFFMHPADAVHGDLGMLKKDDVVLALSNSGETDEIKFLLPTIKRMGIPIISITGNTSSTLAKNSAAALNSHVSREACPLNLAPTSSTTVALVMGDALAAALMVKRNFTERDFASVHPAGILGRRLLLRVEDIWHTGSELPIVHLDTHIKDILYTISSKRFGCAVVTDSNGILSGIVTDGDLRRAMEKYSNIMELQVEVIMSDNPKKIDKKEFAAAALQLMEQYSITTLVCVDQAEKPTGIVHMHDLLKLGLT